MSERVQRLNMQLLLVVVFYTIVIQQFLLVNPILNPWLDSAIAFLTSIGFYRILLGLVYRLVKNNRFLLRLYWGRLFIDGLWSYTYSLEGVQIPAQAQNKRYFGVWRFEQDLFQTKLTGFGLNENFEIRSQVRSVTDLLEVNGAYEIVNIRNDSVDPERDYYSKSSMVFDLNRGAFRYPVKMRAKTVIYGGALSGRIHRDTFTRHEGATSEDDVISDLRQQFESSLIPITEGK